MKFTKKNAFAIGTAVMMTAALATFASASTPASSSVLVNMNEDSLWVEAVDVDLSTMDFSQALESTPVAAGAIDPEDVPCSVTAAAPAVETGVASVVIAEIGGVDLSTIGFGQVLEDTPIPVGTIDPAAVNGSGTTQAKPAE